MAKHPARDHLRNPDALLAEAVMIRGQSVKPADCDFDGGRRGMMDGARAERSGACPRHLIDHGS